MGTQLRLGGRTGGGGTRRDPAPWVLVICPFMPANLATPAGVARAYRKVLDGCRAAQARGARIVALGGFTSIVAGGQGERLTGEVEIAVTSGNTLTAALALEQLDRLFDGLGWDLGRRGVAIVGAGGDIGRACALALAPRVARLTLIGRSTPKLRAVADVLPSVPAPTLSSDVAACRSANVVIAATSAVEPILDEADLAPGTVVCDISYPRAVRRASESRADVLVFNGGIAESGSSLDIGYLTRLPADTFIHGCYAEAMALSLAGRDESYSIGQGRISLERMAEIRALAAGVGVKTGPAAAWPRAHHCRCHRGLRCQCHGARGAVSLSQTTEARVCAIVATKLQLPPEQVPLDEPIMDGLGLDSFDAMEVVLDIEAAYDHLSLTDADAREITTLREVIDYIDRSAPSR